MHYVQMEDILISSANALNSGLVAVYLRLKVAEWDK